MNGLELTLLPAAVSPLVAAEVAGERRRAGSSQPSRPALYLDLGTHERVLAVLAADAVALPIGIRLARLHAVRWGVEPGERVSWGTVGLPAAD